MNVYYIAGYPVTDELYHFGIAGQKHGVRRFQNEDGTLTYAGRLRYGVGILQKGASGDEVKNMQKALSDAGYGKLLSRYGADGKFGSETQAALNRFKKDHGLPQDGKFDAATKSYLDKAVQRRTGQTTSTSAQSVEIDPAIREAAEALSKIETIDPTTETEDNRKKTSGSSKKKKKKTSGGNKKETPNDDSSDGHNLFQYAGGIPTSKLKDLLSKQTVDSATSLIDSVLGGENSLLTEPITVSSGSKTNPLILRSLIRMSAINGQQYVDRLLKYTQNGGKSK